jgi:thiol-disulfide isomerase/thioredoxin
MRPAGLVVGAMVLALGAGCATSSNDAATAGPSVKGAASSFAPPPSTAELVSRAGLAACPVPGHGAAALPSVTQPCHGAGAAVPMARLTGAPTVLNVWASWCEPCRREVPFFQALHARAGDRLRVLGVDTEDSSRSALDFAAHAGMRYPSVVDEDGTVLRSFRGVGPPMTVFVAADGRVVHVARGEYQRLADLQRDVETYLGVRL